MRARLPAIVALGCTLSSGCASRPPGRVETSVITWAKHNVTVGGSHDRNPMPGTRDHIESGKQTFGAYCVVCHGRDGQNTGVPFAQALSPPPPSLASAPVQSYTDGQLRSIIANGISPSGMPASKGILRDEDIWNLVVYIRHLPPAGSLGEPRAYSGDEYESTSGNQREAHGEADPHATK
jgi:mono/diheme cytochrome c family protein